VFVVRVHVGEPPNHLFYVNRGRSGAAIYSLIISAKMDRLDPHSYPADLLSPLPDHTISRIAKLLPWNWGGVTTLAA
jgi:hypothetical protein